MVVESQPAGCQRVANVLPTCCDQTVIGLLAISQQVGNTLPTQSQRGVNGLAIIRHHTDK